MAFETNYSRVIPRALHATPRTVVLRPSPSPSNSSDKWPVVGDVRSGTAYGPGQFFLQEYRAGTMAAGGGGTTVYTFVG